MMSGEKRLTNSKAVHLLSMGPSFFPTSDLNAPGSGAARKRMAVFMGFVDLLIPKEELDKVGRVEEGAEEEGDP